MEDQQLEHYGSVISIDGLDRLLIERIISSMVKRNVCRRLAAVMTVPVMVMVCMYCGGDEVGTDAAVCCSDSNKAVLGEYEAKITGYEIMEDYDGDNAIVITYDFTNNGKEAESFKWAVTERLFQEGEELEYASIFLSEDSLDMLDENVTKEIKPGRTLQVRTAHKLDSVEKPVILHLTDLFRQEVFKKELDISLR